MKTKIAVLGGDLRQYTAGVELSRRDWNVALWGLDIPKNNRADVKVCYDFFDAVRDAKAVILPLPASVDGVFLNSPFLDSSENVKLSELLGAIDKDCTIIGGKLPDDLYSSALRSGFITKDYFLSEDFQIKNAYITAEAAVNIAMNSLNKNLRGSNIAITGYGRIAKHLVNILTDIGAEITVAARKTSDLAWSVCNGCRAIRIGDSEELRENIFKLSSGYDIIYNTVPHRLFDRNFLEEMDKNTFIIDLASLPGGMDIKAAKELGANVLWATSLPGKYAPVSAGKLIAEYVDGILKGGELD